jgi:YVTN family beta-propeller protein
LLARDDAAWVASFAEDTVYRIDPVTNKIIATIKVGRGPTVLAFHNGLVWVANAYDDDVLRIDPATNMVVGRRIPVNARPVAMVSDGRSLWVANFGDDTVSRLDTVSADARVK